jgi:imidazolonepropionase-like amidohydrolase
MATTASRIGIRFGGHVPEAVGLMHALRMGQHTFDHIDGYLQALNFPAQPIDSAKVVSLAATTRDAGALIVPTMVLWEHVIGHGDPDEKRAWPEMKYWPRAQVNNWHSAMTRRQANIDRKAAAAYAQARRDVLKQLADAGVGILMGTDSPQIFSVPGFSIHREMAAMSAAGMSNSAILASGTRNVGIYLQGKDAFGAVAVGHRADLILLKRNPLDDLAAIATPTGVMVRGVWLPATEIGARLDAIARR